MKKRIWFLLVLGVILLSACETEEYLTCPDNVTRVLDLADCPEEKPVCKGVCEDNNSCTFDRCNQLTDYECVHEDIFPCDGNDICEEGEFPWSEDCPDTCDDSDACTEDTYNYVSEICFHEAIIPCCNNTICDKGETYVNCPLDCEQQLDVWVLRYEKRQKFVESPDLTRTDFIYLIVYFKMKNLAINNVERFNYKDQKGFYYDPFKMRLEDDKGALYDAEYDSDLITDWLDYTIIPMGDSKGAALLFTVPMSASHTRLIVYDKYGSKLDSSDVY